MIVVDRIEGKLAVCEIDNKMVDIPLSKISKNVKEGDVLQQAEHGSFYTINATLTTKRRAEVTALFEQLKAKNKK